jgi:hypothetical protein
VPPTAAVAVETRPDHSLRTGRRPTARWAVDIAVPASGPITVWLRAGWGTALVLGPRRALASCGSSPARAAVIATRALGLRDLAQAAWLRGRPSARRTAVSQLVDGLHAASMAILASARRDHRGAALASLAMSLLLLGASAVEVDDRRR